jgi:hypothetical protein
MPKPAVITEEMRQAGREARAEKKARIINDIKQQKEDQRVYWTEKFNNYDIDNPYNFKPVHIHNEYVADDEENYVAIGNLFFQAAELKNALGVVSVYIGRNYSYNDWNDSLPYEMHPEGAYILTVERMPTESESAEQKRKYDERRERDRSFYKTQMDMFYN